MSNERASILAVACVLAASVVTPGCAARGERAAWTAWRAASAGTARVRPAAPAGFGPLSSSHPDSVLVRARQTSPALRSALDAWHAALEAVPAAGSLPDPRVSYAFSFERVETRVGPQRQRLGIAQTLPLGKLGPRRAAAFATAEAARARFDAAWLALRLRVLAASAEHHATERAIEVTRASVELLDRLERTTNRRYAAGEASQSELLRAQVELARLEDRLLALEDERAPIVARLNAELDRPATAPISPPDTLAAAPLAVDDADALETLALEHSPAIREARAHALRARRDASVAARRSIPDLTLGADWIDTGEAHMAGVLESGKDPVMATVSINLPIWPGPRAERRAASAAARAAEARLAEAKRALRVRLEAGLVAYRNASRRVDLHASTLRPRALQAVQVSERAYAAGSIGFQDVVDAQRTLLEVELELARARAERVARAAELESLVGLELRATGGEDVR